MFNKGAFSASSLLYLLFPRLAYAQAIPSILPSNWSSFGCYTDVSTSRTLRAQSYTSNNNMTIENCISFCSSPDLYLYAGVEFGGECYCDSAIQVPSVLAAPTDCDMACNGNSTELCGGPSRLNVFINNAAPVPVIVQSVNNGRWVYQGCFTDTPANRTLPVGINIPAGVTAETCTATCQTAGYSLAGLENGRECWCANAFSNAPTLHVSDNDCRTLCLANSTEFCGNADRVAVYADTLNGGSSNPGQENCSQTSLANFTLTATYKLPPASGPSTIPLKVILVEMVPSVTWAILSACSLCCSDWPTFSMQNSVFMPQSLSNPLQLMVSSAPGDGESPNFVASNPAFPGFQSYCVVNSGAGASSNILAFGEESDAFSLCKNNTANDRLDVVFSPVTGHPHYSLEDCSAITIQVVT